MTKRCGFCNNYLDNDLNKDWIFSGDKRVCSKRCAKLRNSEIYNIDSTFESPILWNCRINELRKDKNNNIFCGYCNVKSSKINMLHKCSWCDINYCSIECQREHWISGHSNTCWRNGRSQPTKINPTPSILDFIIDISGRILGCIGINR